MISGLNEFQERMLEYWHRKHREAEDELRASLALASWVILGLGILAGTGWALYLRLLFQ